VGRVVVQAPAFTLYCKVDPVGQGVPVGAVILPPETVHPVPHVLFVMVTLAGAVDRVGQVRQVTGAVVAIALVLTHPVVLLIHLAKTVIGVGR
jgi:hypothetical protein